MREDFRSTDLEGAAYYAGIYGDGFELADERVSPLEAEWDEALADLDLEQTENAA